MLDLRLRRLFLPLSALVLVVGLATLIGRVLLAEMNVVAGAGRADEVVEAFSNPSEEALSVTILPSNRTN